MWVFFILALFNSVDILLSKNCHPGLELRAWSLERGFTTQSSKLKALSNEETKSLEQGISTVVKHSLYIWSPAIAYGNTRGDTRLGATPCGRPYVSLKSHVEYGTIECRYHTERIVTRVPFIEIITAKTNEDCPKAE